MDEDERRFWCSTEAESTLHISVPLVAAKYYTNYNTREGNVKAYKFNDELSERNTTELNGPN